MVIPVIVVTLGMGTGRVGNQRISEDNPDNSIFEIGQNTEKSPGELRRLAITQTPVKDQLMLEKLAKSIVTIFKLLHHY